MLLNFKFKNFATFKELTEFNMIPGKVTARFSDNVAIVDGKQKVSKIAVIAGENAGGKTSLIKSLGCLQKIIETNKLTILRGANANSEEPYYFEISVVLGSKILTYELEYDKFSVKKEVFSIRPLKTNKDKNVIIYEVERISSINELKKGESISDVRLSSRYISKELHKYLKDKIEERYSGIFLNILSIIGVSEITEFKKFIEKDLSLKIPDEMPMTLYTEMENKRDILTILEDERFFEIFKLVDSTIKRIEVDKEEPFKDTVIIRHCGAEENKVLLSNDSSGVKDFFAWAISIWEVLYENKTLFADEVDRVLNSILAARVIGLIKGSDHKGQFIFTTHNVLHLTTDVFMKEQINFVSKDSITLNSELYSLADFEEFSYDNPRVYELYLKGILGAVPND